MAVEKFIPDGIIIGEMLYNQNRYEVPPYQRDYSWKKIHIGDFWNDINSIKEDIYYFGSMLFKSTREDKSKISIIDGQQRLITITIFLAVIRDLFYREGINDKEDATLTQTYIIRKITKDKKIFKLTLNLRNKNMFYHCIQCDPYNDSDYKTFDEYEKEFGKKYTNKLIKDAYNFFKEKIEERLNNLKTKNEKIEYLTDLSEKVREKLAIISITVTDIREAYMIFETINQRGVDLAVSDLFKNYLISKSKNREDMIDIWERIFDILDNKIKGFLKHYWHSKKEVVQERILFRELTKFVEDEKNKIDVDLLTKEIEKESKVYSALQDSESDYWDEDEDIQELLREFSILNLKQSLPLLVIGNLKFSDSEFKKLLRMIVNFGFRYHIICKLPPNVLEKIYSQIAVKIRGEDIEETTKIINVKGVLEDLQKIDKYPSDNMFEKLFKGKTFKKDHKIIRYILKKIETNKFRKIDKQKENTEPINYDKFTLEHVLPQNMDDEWKEYFKNKKIALKDVNEWIHRLGNLTLLDQKKNEFSKNEFITKKCEKAYNLSYLKINEALKSLTDWDIDDIEKREEDFFVEAKEIWKID